MRFALRHSLLLAVVLSSVASAQEPAKALEYYSLVQKFSEATAASKWEEAADLAQRALAISDVDGDVWNQYGVALARLNKYEQAIAAYVQALEKGAFANKHRAVASFAIASSNAHLGRKDEALKWLNESFNTGHRDIRMFRNSEFEVLKGYGNYDELAAVRDLTGVSRDDGLAYDLWFMDRELRRIHFAPYGVTPKETLDKELASIKAAIPTMTNEEFMVRCRAYVAMIGDGHTALRVNQWAAPDSRQTPIRLIKFTDGVFVSGASESFKHLIGRKLLAINGVRTEELWKRLATLVSRDNTYDDVAQVPALMGFVSLLKGTGLAKGDDAKFTFQNPGGGATEVTIPFEAPGQVVMSWQSFSPLPLYLQNPNKAYWYTYLEPDHTVYMQYNAVRNDTEPITAFMERMFKELEGKPIDKFVVDVRFNGGGNSFLNSGIQRPLMRNPEINKKGKLFIITGRNTFSAAQNFTTDFNRETEAIFVGEPTGSRPNFVGETIPVVLPYTKMRMTVSDLYWQRSWPMDHRMWIPPDIPTEMSSAIYFAGRDAAMEAILAFGKGGP